MVEGGQWLQFMSCRRDAVWCAHAYVKQDDAVQCLQQAHRHCLPPVTSALLLISKPHTARCKESYRKLRIAFLHFTLFAMHMRRCIMPVHATAHWQTNRLQHPRVLLIQLPLKVYKTFCVHAAGFCAHVTTSDSC